MSEFDSSIRQAKRQHLRLQVVAALVLALVALGLVLWLGVVKGYSIRVLPQEAAQNPSLSTEKGLGWVMGDKLYALSGSIQLKVSAKDYQDALVTLDGNSPKQVTVRLEPKPARVIANVDGAGKHASKSAWKLDNSLIEIAEQVELSLAPGEYELVTDNPYFQPVTSSLSLSKNQQLDLPVKLTPVQGSLELNSVPAGATLSVNGTAAKTPYFAKQLGGVYQVEVNAPGYEPVSETIEITHQRPVQQRRYQLEPLKALLRVQAEPQDGVLLVNGREMDTRQPLRLAANRQHQLVYQKPGFFSQSQVLTLAVGEEKSLRIQLKPELGEVVIDSTPVANLSINGVVKGTTPFSGKLPAVPTKVRLRLEGYRTIEKTITPSSQQLTRINETLYTEFEARRREGKPTVASQLGIEMQAFQPTEVSMGSPPNEKGRRRNEFVYQVQFTRPILVSRHEITEAQFAAFSGATSRSKLPVTGVSWQQAVAFCNWLSEQDGLPPFYRLQGGQVAGVNLDASGYRLPSEAEWEWLAKRALRATGTTYVWGETERIPKDAGNFADESIKAQQALHLQGYNDGQIGKAAVGSYKADRAGLFDLAGNVSEWVHDSYTNQPPAQSQYTDYLGASRGEGHVTKGGNFRSGTLAELRVAYREPGAGPAETVGFRIARYQQ